MLFSFLNSSISQSTIFWSTSSPPRCVSPSVDFHFDDAGANFEHRDVERAAAEVVDRDRLVVFLSRPYANAAAVGSLMMRTTSRPAISPACLVACRCASLKYAGTVMTAFCTFSPRKSSAADFSLPKIIAEISGGL